MRPTFRISMFVLFLGAAAEARKPEPPPAADDHAGQGRMLARDGRCEEAIAEYKLALMAAPLPEYFLAIADCQDLLKQTSAAAASYRRFVDAAPDHPEAPRAKRRLASLEKDMPAAKSAAPEKEEDSEQEWVPPSDTPAAAHTTAAPAAASAGVTSRRIVGIGTGIAIGGASRSIPGTLLDVDPNLVVILPDVLVSMPVPIPRLDAEVEVWVPWGNLILNPIGYGFSSFWMDVFLKIYLPLPIKGLFAAPGIGFWWTGTSLADPAGGAVHLGSLEIPARLGYEYPLLGGHVVLRGAARVWLDVILGNATSTTVGGGGMLEIGASYYFLKK